MSSNPVKAEALGESFSVDFDGVAYTIEPATEWDLDVLEAIEDGKMTTALRTLLGREQWATFKAKRRTAADLGTFYSAVEQAIGAPGN